MSWHPITLYIIGYASHDIHYYALHYRLYTQVMTSNYAVHYRLHMSWHPIMQSCHPICERSFFHIDRNATEYRSSKQIRQLNFPSMQGFRSVPYPLVQFRFSNIQNTVAIISAVVVFLFLAGLWFTEAIINGPNFHPKLTLGAPTTGYSVSCYISCWLAQQDYVDG